MPKVELHLHLEGAAPPAFIAGLAKEKHLDIAGVFDERGNYRYKDFWDFLKVYEAATSALQTPRDYQRLVLAVLEESAASRAWSIRETFLSPDFCGGRDVGAWREYLHAMQEAADQAEREMGITLRGIITCIRHFGPDKARETARCAAETAGDWIVGFGIAGDEKIGAAEGFPLVLRLRARGRAAADGACRGMGRAGERAGGGARSGGGADRAWRARDRGSGAGR